MKSIVHSIIYIFLALNQPSFQTRGDEITEDLSPGLHQHLYTVWGRGDEITEDLSPELRRKKGGIGGEGGGEGGRRDQGGALDTPYIFMVRRARMEA